MIKSGYLSLIWIMVVILLLGGCGKMNKQDETDLMKEAKTIAVQHLKEKYEIDVEITKQKMLPTYVNDEITMEGHVIGHPDQSFNIAVDYKEKKTMNFAMSPELVSAIRAKGHEPFIKK